jgi:phosphocarrier protein
MEVQISNRLGLHARAAARFVHVATRFKSRVTVIKDRSRVDGKSILGLLTLAASQGSCLRLCAEGDDEEQVLLELDALVRSGFGEER